MAEDIYNKQKQNFLNFMKDHNLNANSWAKKAGISEATIRHFLSGRNKSITLANLEKLARAAGVSPSTIIKEDSRNLILDKDQFIEAYCNVHQFINISGKKLDLLAQAKVILAWYELSILNKNNNTLDNFLKLITNIVAK